MIWLIKEKAKKAFSENKNILLTKQHHQNSHFRLLLVSKHAFIDTLNTTTTLISTAKTKYMQKYMYICIYKQVIEPGMLRIYFLLDQVYKNQRGWTNNRLTILFVLSMLKKKKKKKTVMSWLLGMKLAAPLYNYIGLDM